MDITTLTDWLLNQSIPLVILAGLGWFLLAKLWPWLTEVYIPAQQQLDEKMAESFVQVALHHICACFDEIGHGILVDILRKKVRDERFLNLIWKLYLFTLCSIASCGHCARARKAHSKKQADSIS
jgi:hypothetical protein